LQAFRLRTTENNFTLTIHQAVVANVKHHPMSVRLLWFKQEIGQQFNIEYVQHAMGTAVVQRRPHHQRRHAFGDRQGRAQGQLHTLIIHLREDSRKHIITWAKQA